MMIHGIKDGGARGYAKRGIANPERGISEETRWGWGPSATEKS
jgi:hypothetical protein